MTANKRKQSNSHPTCTVCIVLDILEENSHKLEKLRNPLADTSYKSGIHFLYIDKTGDSKISSKIRMFCLENEIEYALFDKQESTNVSSCVNNYAAQHAKTRFIFFSDINVIPPTGFYDCLLQQIEEQKLEENSGRCIVVPVCNFADIPEEILLAENIDYDLNSALLYLQKSNGDHLEFYFRNSYCLYDRRYFLARGGERKELQGSAFSAFELNSRILLLSDQFENPGNIYTDVSKQNCSYDISDWQCLFNLFAKNSLMKGLALFQIDADLELGQSSPDHHVYFDYMQSFLSYGDEPSCLADGDQGKTIVVRQNAFTTNRYLHSFLGDVEYLDLDSYPKAEDALKIIKQNGYSRVLFHNPYADGITQQLYEICRREEFPYIIAERGALNKSIFYDPNGFLIDSSSYDMVHWNKEIGEAGEDRVKKYIVSDTSSPDMLEPQGERKSLETVKEELNIDSEVRTLLICFQRPQDTVTVKKSFIGSFGTYKEFETEISRFTHETKGKIRFLYKIHPMEDSSPDILGDNVSSYHLYDLLPLVDGVVCFNSGVGLQSLLFNKPAYLFGNAFYSHPDLNVSIRDVSEMDKLLASFQVNTKLAYRFLYYLIEEFYSFGNMNTEKRIKDDGSYITATYDIAFETLTWVDGQKIKLKVPAGFKPGHRQLRRFAEANLKRDLVRFRKYLFLKFLYSFLFPVPGELRERILKRAVSLKLNSTTKRMLERYNKYRGSRFLLCFRPILPRKLVARLESRKAKNAPGRW